MLKNNKELIKMMSAATRSKPQWEESIKHALERIIHEKKRKDYLTEALREINEKPVFYQLGDAYLYITLEQKGDIWVIFRKWGTVNGSNNQATVSFRDRLEALRSYELIVSGKVRSGYKPIF